MIDNKIYVDDLFGFKPVVKREGYSYFAINGTQLLTIAYDDIDKLADCLLWHKRMYEEALAETAKQLQEEDNE